MSLRLRARASGMTALLCLALVGCYEEPPAPKTTLRLPEEVCKQAREGLEKLAEGSQFELIKPGEAMMPDQAWLELAPEARNQLAQLIGYDAACRASEPSAEQTVIIRSEVGRLITERIVSTSADLSKLLQD